MRKYYAGIIILALVLSSSIAWAAEDKNELLKDIMGKKSIMWIGPHPDDEIAVAGTLALACADNGNKGYIVCLGSLQNIMRGVNIGLRKDAIDYFSKKYFIEYKFLDAKFTVMTPKVLKALRSKLITFIEQNKPAVIITFSPAGYYGNRNHIATSRLVTEVVSDLSYKPKLYYVINMDQEMVRPVYEYEEYPPSDIVNLDVYSVQIGKTLWDAKLDIWQKYSSSVPIIKGFLSDKKRIKRSDHKEYFRKEKVVKKQ